MVRNADQAEPRESIMSGHDIHEHHEKAAHHEHAAKEERRFQADLS